MVQLSNTISNIKPSETLSLAARVAELRAEGKEVLGFTVGEPDFDTPDRIKEAAVSALKSGRTRYTPVAGILPLREAICSKVKRDQGLEYKPSEVIVTNGGKHALAAAFAVLLNPGDEVVLAAPYWTSYPDMVRIAGGEPVIINTDKESGYLIQPEALRRACNARTKAIIINSPSNPTGAAYDENELRALADVVRSLGNSKNIAVVSDEVYEYITFDGFEHVSFGQCAPDLRSRTLIVNALSKSYAMTGWRVGYAVGPEAIIKAMQVHQSQFTSNVCSIAQYAAIDGLEMGLEFPREIMCKAFQRRLDILWRAMEKIPSLELPLRPRGAFYAFIRIEGVLGKKAGDEIINSSADFCKYLMDKYAVIVVPGEAFGDSGAFRLSFAVDDETLVKGLDRIAQAVSSLRS